MTSKIVLSEIPFSSLETQTTSHEVQTDWLALSQTVTRNKVLFTWLKTVYDSRSHQNQGHSGRNDEKMVARQSQTDVTFVVMDDLVNVLVGAVALSSLP